MGKAKNTKAQNKYGLVQALKSGSPLVYLSAVICGLGAPFGDS